MVGHFNAARQEEGIYEYLVTLQTSLWRHGSHAEGAEGKEAEDGSHIYGASVDNSPNLLLSRTIPKLH